MKFTGNTIFVTGGGSGIGRGLAETLHRLGNQVIISGRRKGHLAETTKANPGMKSVELDVEDPASTAAVTRKLIADYPKLNVLINNAGVMHIDNAAGAVDEAMLVSTITTNLMGPIRMTGALIHHLKKQDHAVVMNVSSVLGFVPLAMAAVYFCGDLSEQEQKLVWATQGVPKPDLFEAKVGGTAWKSKQSWYIVAKKDHTVHPDLERAMAKRMGATTYEVDSSHVPMLSQPGFVLDVIRNATSTSFNRSNVR